MPHFVRQLAQAQRQHTEVAAVGAVEVAALPRPDGAQPQLLAPPQRQVQRQQPPVEA